MGRKYLWLSVLVVLGVPIALTIAVFASMREPRLKPGSVVHVRDGAIQGAIIEDVAVYRGIPFAAPPVGDLRWRTPQRVKPWSGVLAATSFRPACMQAGAPVPGSKRGPISEDCLYLNVWAPSTLPQKRLPVIVFLHGGGGISGSPSARPYWGDELVRRGVVTVNLSYRLGMLGWLAHPELTQEASYGASGNYALLDMIAGLRWVRDNIAAFGGDPDNVTLMGHSAGAYSASKLMVSPLAKDLFHKVIGQSGGDLYPAGTDAGNAFLADAERVGVEFATRLGAASIAELRRIPADRIIASLPEHRMRLPIIDGYALTGDTADLYAHGKQYKMPIMLGYTAAEGANLVEKLVASEQDFIAQLERDYGEFASRFVELYPARSPAEARQSQMRLAGERTANWPIATWASLHTATGESDVYVYYFAKRPPFGPLRKLGAAHGAELPYVFGSTPGWMRMFTQWPWKARRDLAVAEQMPAYWTNFARTANPNADGVPEWRTYNRTREVLHFAEDATRSGAMRNRDEHALMNDYIRSLRAAGQGAGSSR